MWSLFLFWPLVRLNCACNSGVEHVSRPEGFDLISGRRAKQGDTACVVDASFH